MYISKEADLDLFRSHASICIFYYYFTNSKSIFPLPIKCFLLQQNFHILIISLQHYHYTVLLWIFGSKSCCSCRMVYRHQVINKRKISDGTENIFHIARFFINADKTISSHKNDSSRLRKTEFSTNKITRFIIFFSYGLFIGF